MNKYVKEFPFWILIMLPYAYLATIWNKLPDQVPTHFNVEGVADDWSNKTSLLFMPGAIGIGIYILMLIIPALDPKKKLQQMGGKYYTLRLILTLFMSLLSTYLLFATYAGNIKNPNMLFALLGAFFAVMGNYFQAMRPNYFIGIRTPWTLESENVWKKTHRLGGPLWMAGGILIVIFSFIVRDNKAFAIAFGAMLFIMVIVPVIYSYTEFQKEKNILSQ